MWTKTSSLSFIALAACSFWSPSDAPRPVLGPPGPGLAPAWGCCGIDENDRAINFFNGNVTQVFRTRLRPLIIADVEIAGPTAVYDSQRTDLGGLGWSMIDDRIVIDSATHVTVQQVGVTSVGFTWDAATLSWVGDEAALHSKLTRNTDGSFNFNPSATRRMVFGPCSSTECPLIRILGSNYEFRETPNEVEIERLAGQIVVRGPDDNVVWTFDLVDGRPGVVTDFNGDRAYATYDDQDRMLTFRRAGDETSTQITYLDDVEPRPASVQHAIESITWAGTYLLPSQDDGSGMEPPPRYPGEGEEGGEGGRPYEEGEVGDDMQEMQPPPAPRAPRRPETWAWTTAGLASITQAAEGENPPIVEELGWSGTAATRTLGNSRLSYEFDTAGNLIGLVETVDEVDVLTVERDFDAAHNVIRQAVSDWWGWPNEYLFSGYNSRGKPAEIRFEGMVYRYTYDATGELVVTEEFEEDVPEFPDMP